MGEAPWITASPNPVPISQGCGTTTIAWSSGSERATQIYVSRDGGPEKLFAGGIAGKSQGLRDARWITPGADFEFRMYAMPDRQEPLASTVVTSVVSQNLKPREDCQPIRPRMSAAEIDLFMSSCLGKESVVEFGLGGSTLCLLQAGVKEILSVETDPIWVARVAEHELVRPHIASGRLSMCEVDVGPTKGWGRPADRSKQATWPAYWQEPWRRVETDKVDLVFVDGRFRVASTLNAMLQGSEDLTIVVHDFWTRPGYHVLLKYLNCACRADSLGVFFVKRRVDSRAMLNDLLRHAFVVD